MLLLLAQAVGAWFLRFITQLLGLTDESFVSFSQVIKYGVALLDLYLFVSMVVRPSIQVTIPCWFAFFRVIGDLWRERPPVSNVVANLNDQISRLREVDAERIEQITELAKQNAQLRKDMASISNKLDEFLTTDLSQKLQAIEGTIERKVRDELARLALEPRQLQPIGMTETLGMNDFQKIIDDNKPSNSQPQVRVEKDNHQRSGRAASRTIDGDGAATMDQ